MKLMVAILVALVLAPSALAEFAPTQPITHTRSVRILYRAHDGVMRPAWLLLPANYDGRPIPLVISPHGRGVSAVGNASYWGDLPGVGRFAVINPGGEGRRLHAYSWGDPGQITDLARMPSIVESHGVRVDRRRIYAVGGSMGGQETLLLVARYPHLLAGAAAFDPATDMRRRYYDFARLKGGASLQALARQEFGGTPTQVPNAYAQRSPDHFVRQIAHSNVPLQLYWSLADRVITDQTAETGALADLIVRSDGGAKLWEFQGDWVHTAEMRATRRLPRALVRFGLISPRDAPPPTPAVRRARTRLV